MMAMEPNRDLVEGVAADDSLSDQSLAFLAEELRVRLGTDERGDTARSTASESLRLLIDETKRVFPNEDLQPAHFQSVLGSICQRFPNLYPWCIDGEPT